MENINSAVETLISSSNTYFILLGAIMVLFMHAGFAFLEVGTVRKKNQVNALVKIITDFGVSTIAYFFVGYGIAYGSDFFASATELSQNNGYELVKFFFAEFTRAAIRIESGFVNDGLCAGGSNAIDITKRVNELFIGRDVDS